MSDILEQMTVTAANGEPIMFFDLRNKAAKDGRREEYEAARMHNLMSLGVKEHEFGPFQVTDASVSFVKPSN